MKIALCLLASAFLASSLHAAEARPNVLIILADDLGFSDLGCYGSEIETPNLDELARTGIRLTEFYNTAKCHSSRVSLLTGRWCREAGDRQMTRATTMAEVLGSAGYFTAMSGKWHLEKQPTDFGFARYFGHLSGATNYFTGDDTFRLNDQPWPVPAHDFYTTVANVDFALRFLSDARATSKPWFLYLAFNAPHSPLQPLEEDYKKYLGRYDAGWDAMRTARVSKQKSLGLFGTQLEACPRPDHIPAWDQLSPSTRDWEARRMAAYAGLIDRLDHEVGRVIADLKAHGELANTLLVFCSDNGACPYDGRPMAGRALEPYDPKSRWSDSTGWAWARNSPFRYYKQNQFEGGIATPGIIHWPAGLKVPAGGFVHAPAHLVDLLPTISEVCSAPLPTAWPGRELSPLAGTSLAALFRGEEMKTRPIIHLLYDTDRGLRDGDWKLVSYRQNPWELYNMATDRTELHDLAAAHPDVVARMSAQWHAMTKDVLRAAAREQEPVFATPQPQQPGYTDYGLESGRDPTERAPRARKRKAATAETSATRKPDFRPRKDTALEISGAELVLTSTGNDPGLSFDRLPRVSKPGPYRLSFSVLSHSTGGAEIYWTTDAGTKLPNGHHQDFQVKHDGQWQNIVLSIETQEQLHALRLDPCAGPGEVRIKDLQLQDASGATLEKWPEVTPATDSKSPAKGR